MKMTNEQWNDILDAEELLEGEGRRCVMIEIRQGCVPPWKHSLPPERAGGFDIFLRSVIRPLRDRSLLTDLTRIIATAAAAILPGSYLN